MSKRLRLFALAVLGHLEKLIVFALAVGIVALAVRWTFQDWRCWTGPSTRTERNYCAGVLSHMNLTPKPRP